MRAVIKSAIVAITVLPIVSFGQTRADLPIQTTVCEVLSSPALFNGKVITVRAPVQIAFEDFRLSAPDCTDKKIDYLWLEYGRGPKRQPTTLVLR